MHSCDDLLNAYDNGAINRRDLLASLAALLIPASTDAAAAPNNSGAPILRARTINHVSINVSDVGGRKRSTSASPACRSVTKARTTASSSASVHSSACIRKPARPRAKQELTTSVSVSSRINQERLSRCCKMLFQRRTRRWSMRTIRSTSETRTVCVCSFRQSTISVDLTSARSEGVSLADPDATSNPND